jgi:hypothetical protein
VHRVYVVHLDSLDPLETLDALDLQVTQETQERLVPMDPPDPPVPVGMTDAMERRGILDQGDPPAILDHLDTVKVALFKPRTRSTLALHRNQVPTMVHLRILPLHAGTFLSNLAPRS